MQQQGSGQHAVMQQPARCIKGAGTWPPGSPRDRGWHKFGKSATLADLLQSSTCAGALAPALPAVEQFEGGY